MPDKKHIMTIKQLAQYLGVHISTVYKYAQQGKIPAFKIGSDWRFHKLYIDKWIAHEIKNNGSEGKKTQELTAAD